MASVNAARAAPTAPADLRKNDGSSVTVPNIAAAKPPTVPATATAIATAPAPANPPAKPTAKRTAIPPGFEVVKFKKPDGTVVKLLKPLAKTGSAEKVDATPKTSPTPVSTTSTPVSAANAGRKTPSAAAPTSAKTSEAQTAAVAPPKPSNTPVAAPSTSSVAKLITAAPLAAVGVEPTSITLFPAASKLAVAPAPAAPAPAAPAPAALAPTSTTATTNTPKVAPPVALGTATQSHRSTTVGKGLDGLANMDVNKAMTTVENLGTTILKLGAIATGDTATLAELNKQTAASKAGQTTAPKSASVVSPTSRPSANSAAVSATPRSVGVAPTSQEHVSTQISSLTTTAPATTAILVAGATSASAASKLAPQTTVVVVGSAPATSTTAASLPAQKSFNKPTAPGKTAQPQIKIVRGSAGQVDTTQSRARGSASASQVAPATSANLGQTIVVVQQTTSTAASTPQGQAPKPHDQPQTTTKPAQAPAAPKPQGQTQTAARPAQAVTAPKPQGQPQNVIKPTTTQHRSVTAATTSGGARGIGPSPRHPTTRAPQSQFGAHGQALLATAGAVGGTGAATLTNNVLTIAQTHVSNVLNTIVPPASHQAASPANRGPSAAPGRASTLGAQNRLPTSIASHHTSPNQSRDIDNNYNDNDNWQNERDRQDGEGVIYELGEESLGVWDPSMEGDVILDDDDEGADLEEEPFGVWDPSMEGDVIPDDDVEGADLEEEPFGVWDPSMEGDVVLDDDGKGANAEEEPLEQWDPSMEGDVMLDDDGEGPLERDDSMAGNIISDNDDNAPEHEGGDDGDNGDGGDGDDGVDSDEPIPWDDSMAGDVISNDGIDNGSVDHEAQSEVGSHDPDNAIDPNEHDDQNEYEADGHQLEEPNEHEDYQGPDEGEDEYEYHHEGLDYRDD